MSEFTLQDLRRILETSSGVVDDIDWTDDGTVQTPFSELGYDSLALLEAAARVQQEYGIEMPDDPVLKMSTPAAALDYINQRLGAESRSH